jgi:hypothetical protein
MSNKPYKLTENTTESVAEPAVAYLSNAEISSDGWNPNTPFIGTQEEWWEHFHRIEAGEFMSLEEYFKQFDEWKKDLLARKLRSATNLK